MDLGLSGKVAIVCGGGRGIGRVTCARLAEEGARVVVGDIDEASALQSAADINSRCARSAVGVKVDATCAAEVEALLAAAGRAFGGLDILINCHQVWPTALVQDMSEAEWKQTIDVNLTAYFLLCRGAVRSFIDQGKPGRILNFVSQAAFHGSTTGHAHYAAAKAGVVALTLSLAREVAARGIRVNAIAPGMVETPTTEAVLRENRAYYEKRIPLGRIARAEEIAEVAVFLVSDRAGYMTGATVDVSGGMLMR